MQYSARISRAMNQSNYLFVYRTDCRQQHPRHQNTPCMSTLLVHMDTLICLQPEKGREAGRWQDRTNTDNGKRKEKRSTVRRRGRDNCCLPSIKKKGKRENLGKTLRNGIRENLSHLLKRDTRSNNIKHKTRWHLASAAAK